MVHDGGAGADSPAQVEPQESVDREEQFWNAQETWAGIIGDLFGSERKWLFDANNSAWKTLRFKATEVAYSAMGLLGKANLQ